MPIRWRAGDSFELGDYWMRDVRGLAADEDALQRRAGIELIEQPREPFVIDDRDLGAGILKAVLQLRTGPPGIEQNRNAAGQQRTKERRRPFRQIAHRDGDAVALLHAGALQGFGDGERGAGKILVAHALVVIDHEGFLAVCARELEDVAHGRRGVFPDAGADAADVALFDLERRACARQQRVGFGRARWRGIFWSCASSYVRSALARAGEVSIRSEQACPLHHAARGPPPPHFARGRI